MATALRAYGANIREKMQNIATASRLGEAIHTYTTEEEIAFSTAAAVKALGLAKIK